MRLLRLNRENSTWILEDFPGPMTPFYAILSHTWGRNEDEVKYEDIQSGLRRKDDTSKPGYEKLRFCQEKVEKDGLVYFWIDTCCIKKSDSSELQRSLASMFYWYQRAARCYVYLCDVSIHESTEDPESRWEQAFSKSRWFKRGWTLQELIAPSSIFFFSKENSFIGDKKELASTISTITRIPGPALEGLELSFFSRNERMSWTCTRVTTVPEDAAYCLIGIFDVELNMLYAEGDYDKRKNAAMRRLRKAIEVEDTGPQDVLRIGAASWIDLIALDERQLLELDRDLLRYQKWLLSEIPKPEKDKDRVASLSKFSWNADQKMKNLLVKQRVRYQGLSTLAANLKFWENSWVVFKDGIATGRAKRWYWSVQDEAVFRGIIAVRTLEDLMIWRGTWKI
ncbi:unnamed protein product [Alternaria alternata]